MFGLSGKRDWSANMQGDGTQNGQGFCSPMYVMYAVGGHGSALSK